MLQGVSLLFQESGDIDRGGCECHRCVLSLTGGNTREAHRMTMVEHLLHSFAVIFIASNIHVGLLSKPGFVT